jgi:hypothetical protein
MFLHSVWNFVQKRLFPWFEEELDPLTDKEKNIVQIITLMELEKNMRYQGNNGMGRKPHSRTNLIKAFVAKAVYNLDTTKGLVEYLHNSKNLRRLCGWEHKFQIPSEATFSRAFAEFSETSLLQKIHESMAVRYGKSKIAGHVSRDSTSIDAREKPVKKAKPENKTGPNEKKRKRGRPKKGETVPPKDRKRLEIEAKEPLPKIWTISPTGATSAKKKIVKETQRFGTVINCIWIVSTAIFP